MASFYRDGSRKGYRAQVYVRGVKRQLWLGPVSKSQARSVCSHLDQLNLARDTGTIAPAETRRWVSSISPRIRNRLAAWGLVSGASAAKRLPGTIGAFSQHYIESRDDWEPSTAKRMRNVRQHMIAQLGTDTALAAVTPGQAEEFARWCRSSFDSRSHSGKIIGDVRHFFRTAKSHQLIAENPFDGINSSQQHNEDREAYISPDATEKLISNACPYYAALIACARYGGLRVPSEPIALKWSHFDWEHGRFTVTAPKTPSKPTRVVPLFPELRPYVDALHEAAPDRSIWAFHRYRSTAAKVYRSNLVRIIELAGLKPWPKLWMNLRASCRTDLLERFPSHVVDYWLGHSAEVGAKHYDRVHEGHYQAACGVTGGVAEPLSAARHRSRK